MMKITVLGSGAGGGFPQWNCRCAQCEGCRHGKMKARARTQSSIAVSDNDDDWILLNASADIRAQLFSNPQFHPKENLRHTPIKAVMVVDAHIDHCSGLLFLREGKRLPLYCTSAVHEDLTTAFPVIPILNHFCGVDYHPINADGKSFFSVPGFPELTFTAFHLAGKAPPFSPHRNSPRVGDNIGLWIRANSSGKSLFYAPALAEINPEIAAVMRESDVVMVDGTCWRVDEMIRSGLSKKTSTEMGHLPLTGEGGIIPFLKTLKKARKILIHINNSNPILNESSEEFRSLQRWGVEVAVDGMEIIVE